MILVDTSVMIGFLKGQSGEKIELFENILTRDIPFGISAYTYQEVLQGARNEKEYDQLHKYLSTQKIYYLPEKAETYERSARMYFDLRRKGITPRGTIDVLIALTAVEHHLVLLHNDLDFDRIANIISDLRILTSL